MGGGRGGDGRGVGGGQGRGWEEDGGMNCELKERLSVK